MQIRNIIFDWSGTLSDDHTPVYEATMLVFKKLGKEVISKEEYRKEFTLPVEIFWKKYFTELNFEEKESYYREALYKVSKPEIYPGVYKILQEFNDKGINMIIISSHPRGNLIQEAKKYNVSNLFKEINADVADKTIVINEIVNRNNFIPEETIYVGDMTHDIEAGKKQMLRLLLLSGDTIRK